MFRKKKSGVEEKLAALLREKPRFHGRETAGTADYSISDKVLHWISQNSEPGGVTLETGCGYSTVVFSLVSSRHTVISPFPQEHELIKKWCLGLEHSPDNIEFIASFSQDVVHTLGGGEEPDLDTVLIDGDHAFPAPFIDWYYTADRIKRGGHVIVDDTQLVTGKILRDFLLAETKRWECLTEIGKTAVFRKITADPAARGVPWINQPYVNVGMSMHKV